MSNTTRNDVKQLAANIEALARDVQTKLDANGDFLGAANELARNNLTFVFTLGEFYAIEQSGSKKTVKASTVSNPNKTVNLNYHNVRDAFGRFSKKV